MYFVVLRMDLQLSETAIIQYKCDEFYQPESDSGISILDDSLKIDWRIPSENANLKDTKHVFLKDFDTPLLKICIDMNILVIDSNGQLCREMRIVTKISNYRYFFADIVEVEDH